MKLGLIGRDEVARGLAIQSKSFYDNMPVDRVLVVNDPTRRQEAGKGWYGRAPIADWDTVTHTLPLDTMLDFLSGLDAVFTAETPYDWSMLDLARDLGVATVIQGNPEFYKHGRHNGPTQHPTEWWWPSSWRLGALPTGPVMPCPQPTLPFTPCDHGGPLRVLHVVGRRAWKDRNGTDVFMQAIRNVTEHIEVTMYGADGELPEYWPSPWVQMKQTPTVIEDRWDLYREQDVLVLPRRYGGNCLPALEAMAFGLAVIMPNVEPNAMYTDLLTHVDQMRHEVLPCGPTAMADPSPYAIAHTLDLLARDRARLFAEQQKSFAACPRWDVWRPKYLDRLEALIAR